MKHPPFIVTIIFASITAVSGCSRAQLLGKSKFRSVSDARAVAFWLLREAGEFSYPMVALLLGNKDHSSAIAAHRKVTHEIREGGRRAHLLVEVIGHLAKGEWRL